MIEAAQPGAASSEAPAPTPRTAPWKAGQKRPMSADDKAQWDKRAESSDTFRKLFEPQWERGLERYSRARYDTDRYDINALLDFGHVETKKSRLYHKTPEVQLTPVDPADQSVPWAQILPLRQKYLNHKLGPKGAKAKRAFHKALLDALAASGFGVIKVGYERRTLPVPGPDGKPLIVAGEPVEIPIWARCFISRVSPKKVLIPSDFHDSEYDESPWLGVKGTLALSQAKAMKWAIPDDFTGTAQRDEARFTHGLAGDDPIDPLVEFIEIWYRAAYFDPAVFNPDLFRCLILVKGVDLPVWHVDSPYQDLTPEGELTDDSMVGNPICIGTFRDLPDSAYVASDLTVGEQLSREVNKVRTRTMRNAENRQPITLVSDKLDTIKAEKLMKERWAHVPSEHIQPGGQQDLVVVVQAGSAPRDDFATQDIAERDWQKALGASDARSGQISKKKVTATEIRNVSGNAGARDETEKDSAREWVVSIFTKFDCLLQRHADPRDVQKVLGAQGAALWEAWRLLPGKYGYQILPDAGQYRDAAEYQDRVVDLYNLTRKDERVNTDELLSMLALAFNRDPAKFIAPPQDKTTEPPKVSVSFNSVDLNDPVAGRVFLDFAANGGIKLSPDTIALMKAAHIATAAAGALGMGGAPVGANSEPNGHGGSANATEPVNKHQTEKTGRMQGTVQ